MPQPPDGASQRLWIGTSWKMTKTISEATAFVDTLADVAFPDSVQPFVLPAHTALASVRDRLPEGSPVMLGAQNAHWAAEGAGTGEVSMRMVADAGARLVEIGHSERRAQHNETDDSVGRKVRAATDASLVPLVCVGEPHAVRAAGDVSPFVRQQVAAALARLRREEASTVLIAYEPVWAIGEHGRPALPSEVAPVMDDIRAAVRRAGGGCRAVLYGGSVDSTNAARLLGEGGADGLFVGRAAWDVRGYLELVDIAAQCAAERAASRAGRTVST
ncbi:MAG TPA: triose-phosphate isomerase [Segeticoccus sp.]|nr:triose-phosphate isomerase [Segeticoccus sp.]